MLDQIGYDVAIDDLREDLQLLLGVNSFTAIGHLVLNPSDRWRKGWDEFKNAVHHSEGSTFRVAASVETEYFEPDDTPPEAMLVELAEVIHELEADRTMPAGDRLWRVRVHCSESILDEHVDFTSPPQELERISEESSATEADRVM